MALVLKQPHKACSGHVAWAAVAISPSPQNDCRIFGRIEKAFVDLKAEA